MNQSEITELKDVFIGGVHEILKRLTRADQLSDLYPLIRKMERQCDAFRGGLVTAVRNARDNGSRSGRA